MTYLKKKIDTRVETIKVSTLNAFITAEHSRNLSLKARKLLYLAISQCRPITDKEFYEYEISVQEFARLMGIDASNVYRDAEHITDELMGTIIKIQFPHDRNYTKMTLFSICRYTHEKTICFKINPDMSKTLLNLKGSFSEPILADFMRMKSNYSMSVWHLMQQKMKSRKPELTQIIEFDITLEELRKATGTQNKLLQLCEFKQRVLYPALAEIENNAFVKVTCEDVRTGRNVTSFHCVAVSPIHIDLSNIPPSDRFKAKLFRLKQKRKKVGLTHEETKELEELESFFNQQF